jgi:segregation and condensation protein A
MKIKIENFEGPLDLLLQLIEREELDITTVSLLDVADQYINYLSKIEDKKPEMLADFLLIAAKLLYIKSRALLPELETDSDEDSMDLARQLKMYKKFVEASKILSKNFSQNTFSYSRPVNTVKVKALFEPPSSLNSNKLKRIYESIVKELSAMVALPKKSLERVVSIKEKISHIKEMIKNKESFNFSDIISGAQDKTEKIVSFLGMLELVKQKAIDVRQSDRFEEIEITKVIND